MNESALRVDTSFAQNVEHRDPVAFQHSLADHSALTLERVAQLAERLPGTSVINEEAVKPLIAGDPTLAQSRVQQGGDLIRDLDHNDSWVTLLNIEQDPAYCDFVNSVISATARQSSLAPKSWFRRAGFIFASSPGAVTPAHYDIEQSLILQLRGHRTLSFGQFASAEDREREMRRYWNGSLGRLESMPEQSMDVALEPGVGAYIPPFQPHWLHNGDSTSLSLTLTFFTRSNEDGLLIQVFNEKARKLGITPRSAGQSTVRDGAKIAAMRTISGIRRCVRPSSTTPR